MINQVFLTNNRKNKGQFDYYPTPVWATKALMDRVQFEGSILEPASGDGSMSKVLEKYNKVESSDLRPDCYGTSGVDFFSIQTKADNIVTNPPFCFGHKWVEHSLFLSRKKVALFYPLSFLSAQKRSEFLSKSPLRNVFVFAERVPMWKDGKEYGKGAAINFCWYLWEHGYKGKPEIEFLLNCREKQ